MLAPWRWRSACVRQRWGAQPLRASTTSCSRPIRPTAPLLAPRGETAFMPGDWACPSCGGHNFRSRQSCFRCAGPRPVGSSSPVGAPGDRSQIQHSSPGRKPRGRLSVQSSIAQLPPERMNWLCKSCLEVNFARRARCYFCEAERPSLQSQTTDSAAKDEQAGAAPPEPGPVATKWHCPSCTVPNAPDRDFCFVCATARPKAAAGHSTPEAEKLWVCRTCEMPNPLEDRFCPCGERRFSAIERAELDKALGKVPCDEAREWVCTHCTMINHPARGRCMRCGADPGTPPRRKNHAV